MSALTKVLIEEIERSAEVDGTAPSLEVIVALCSVALENIADQEAAEELRRDLERSEKQCRELEIKFEELKDKLDDIRRACHDSNP